MADAVGLRVVALIRSWGEEVYAEYFVKYILPRTYFYSCTGVPGVLPSNNCVESYNNSLKHQKWFGGISVPSSDALLNGIGNLMQLDARERACPPLPCQRRRLSTPARHISRATALLECTKSWLWEPQGGDVLYVDCPYQPSIGARQKQRLKRVREASTQPQSGPRELKRVSSKRVRTYLEACEGNITSKGDKKGEVMSSETIQDKYLSLVRVCQVSLVDGSTSVRCDCKEWFHQFSCPHIELYTHLKGDGTYLRCLTSPPVRCLAGDRRLIASAPQSRGVRVSASSTHRISSSSSTPVGTQPPPAGRHADIHRRAAVCPCTPVSTDPPPAGPNDVGEVDKAASQVRKSRRIHDKVHRMQQE
eukprot:GHVU01194565.1.p1 GENE.GHVU01194565.1~~GHVU01194565.1.p1  ORF type:complete len:362 (+),score=25.31 GHVU01194565.1:1354-2439(+)